MTWKETARIFATQKGRVLVVKSGDKLIGYVKVVELKKLLENKIKSTDISIPESNDTIEN